MKFVSYEDDRGATAIGVHLDDGVLPTGSSRSSRPR